MTDKNELRKVLESIHDNAIKVLFETGFRIQSPGVIAIAKKLEKEGKAAYNESTGHIHIMPEYVQWCLDQAPKKLIVDPGCNSFGLGGCIRLMEDKNEPHGQRMVSYKDLERIVKFISDNGDVIKFSHTPVGPPPEDESKAGSNLFKMAKIMDDNLPGDFLKGISVAEMSDKDIEQLVRPDWIHIFCGVISPLMEIPEKMNGIIRSAKLGAVLGLSTMPMSGVSAPQTIEGLLTLCHAEVLFMLVVAQTVNPGVTCIHDGFPCPTEKYSMRMGSIQHAMAAAAIAHLNMEITKLPSMQSGAASTSATMGEEALKEGVECRAFLRKVRFHLMRHSFGTVDSTTLFSIEKLMLEVELERFKTGEKKGEIIIPEDKDVLKVINRVGSRVAGAYMLDAHTLANIDCWNWRKK